jgi:hypothetical protein
MGCWCCFKKLKLKTVIKCDLGEINDKYKKIVIEGGFKSFLISLNLVLQLVNLQCFKVVML